MPKIEISPVYCKGCGYCIQICPQQTIAAGNQKNALGLHVAEQINAERCTACKLCAVICPDSAITVYK